MPGGGLVVFGSLSKIAENNILSIVKYSAKSPLSLLGCPLDKNLKT